MGRGRPKGSKNKPKERLINAQERSAHRDAGENDESNSDHDRDSDLPVTLEDNGQIIGMENADSDVEGANAEIIDDGTDFQFADDDEYGELFSKLALLPQLEISMNSQRWKECKKAIGNLCREYLREQTDENLFNILSFWKLVKNRGHDKQIKSNIKQLGEGKGREILLKRLQNIHISPILDTVDEQNADEDEDIADFLSDAEIKRATELIEKGALSKAANIIEKATKGVASLSKQVVDTLRILNPKGPINPFGNDAGPEAPIMNDGEILSSVMKDLNKQASAGIDGWTVQRMQRCFGCINDDDEEAALFRSFLRQLYMSMIQGTAPGASMMTAARLTPLWKLNGGIRPICCGILFYRVGMRYAIKSLLRNENILPCQLGVGSKGGVEPILELLQQSVDESTVEHKRYLISLDLKNAFNLLNRSYLAKGIQARAPQLFKLAKYAYDTPAPLILANGKTIKVISNSQGTRQGGPEANALFTIGISPLLQQLTEECLSPTDQLVAYLDNIYVATSDEHLVVDIQDFFSHYEDQTGCKLNMDKCEVIDLYEVKSGIDSIETLGSCIGTVQKRKDFLTKKLQIEEKCID